MTKALKTSLDSLERGEKIDFRVTAEERAIIERISKRAVKLDEEHRDEKVRLPRWTRVDFEMDITACHKNGCPLDLQRLLDADDFNFAHDVFGIRRHLSRTTGKLENHFLPRFHTKKAG